MLRSEKVKSIEKITYGEFPGAIILYDNNDISIHIGFLFHKYINDQNRILANDEIGVVIDIGDLDYFLYRMDNKTKKIIKEKIYSISKPKRPIKLINLELDDGVYSLSEDTILYEEYRPGKIKRLRVDNYDKKKRIIYSSKGVVLI